MSPNHPLLTLKQNHPSRPPAHPLPLRQIHRQPPRLPGLRSCLRRLQAPYPPFHQWYRQELPPALLLRVLPNPAHPRLRPHHRQQCRRRGIPVPPRRLPQLHLHQLSHPEGPRNHPLRHPFLQVGKHYSLKILKAVLLILKVAEARKLEFKTSSPTKARTPWKSKTIRILP